MIKLIINLMILVILALCVRRGFKKGLVGSTVTMILIIVSLIISNILAGNFSKEIVPALQPFISGYIDSDTTKETVLDKLGYGDSEYSLDDILQMDSSLKYDYAYECMIQMGFYTDISYELAEDAVDYADSNNVSVTDASIVVISNTLSYVGCIIIAFIMILILLVSVVDMLNLDIRLPGLDVIDEISGSFMGLLTGFLYCVLICWALGFMGLIIGKETAERDALLNFFLAFRFITRTLV